jgi:hypothetical protein
MFLNSEKWVLNDKKRVTACFYSVRVFLSKVETVLDDNKKAPKTGQLGSDLKHVP